MPARTIAIGDIHGCSAALDALHRRHPAPARGRDRHPGRLHRPGAGQPGRPRSAHRPGPPLPPGPDPGQPRPDAPGCPFGTPSDDLAARHRGHRDPRLLRPGPGPRPHPGGTPRVPGRLPRFPRDRPATSSSTRTTPRTPDGRAAGRMLRWESLRETTPGPHESGKTVIVGHTSQKTGEILDLGHLKCIDTLLLRRWLADRPGRRHGRGLAGGPGGRVAAVVVGPIPKKWR